MLRCLCVVTTAAVVAGCATATTGSGPGVASPPAAPSAAPGTAGSVTAAAGRVVENRAVRGFTGVELSSFGDLQIEQTGTESLSIEAAAEVLPQLTSDVTGGVLRLGLAPGTRLDDAQPVIYRLTVATLDSLAVSGAGDATAANLRAGRLTVDVDGAGDVTLGGIADSQTVTIGGAGDYDGENLQSTDAEITVEGAGDAVVRVSDRLDVTIRGVGSVEYIGDPRVTQDVRGVGSVERR
jgi:hypothetical protein